MLIYFYWPEYQQTNKGKRYYFQQDGALPLRKKEVQDWLKSKFGDHFLDLATWPPRSPDLNPCEFFLRGTLKGKVYNHKPKDVEELKQKIEREVKEFKKSNLKAIFLNTKKRIDLVE